MDPMGLFDLCFPIEKLSAQGLGLKSELILDVPDVGGTWWIWKLEELDQQS